MAIVSFKNLFKPAKPATPQRVSFSNYRQQVQPQPKPWWQQLAGIARQPAFQQAVTRLLPVQARQVVNYARQAAPAIGRAALTYPYRTVGYANMDIARTSQMGSPGMPPQYMYRQPASNRVSFAQQNPEIRYMEPYRRPQWGRAEQAYANRMYQQWVDWQTKPPEPMTQADIYQPAEEPYYDAGGYGGGGYGGYGGGGGGGGGGGYEQPKPQWYEALTTWRYGR
jgi:hypothetical protein